MFLNYWLLLIFSGKLQNFSTLHFILLNEIEKNTSNLQIKVKLVIVLEIKGRQTNFFALLIFAKVT